MKKHNLNKIERKEILNKAIHTAKELKKLMDLDESILYEVKYILMENRCEKCWSKIDPNCGTCWTCFESGPYD